MAQNPPNPKVSETEFEKRRGISRVEVREGYAQVHVNDLPQPVVSGRLDILRDVSGAGISLDFMKFTPDGMSFLVRESDGQKVEDCLKNRKSISVSVEKGKDVVMVHAVNMRDEEGLIASIVLQAIGCGASIGHVSDMHDRVLIVVPKQDSQRLKEQLEGHLVKTRA